MGYADKMRPHVGGVRMISAVAMSRLEYNKYRGWELPSDENGEDEGYLVENLGQDPNVEGHQGYVSWLPVDVFNKEYKKGTDLPFGLAVELMKKGYKMARRGWNGRKMFAVVSPGFENLPSDKFFNNSLAAYAEKELDGSMTIRPCFLLKTAQDDVAYWAPSGSDALAEDWMIVGEPEPVVENNDPDWLIRLKNERYALSNRLDKLKTALQGGLVPETAVSDLEDQKCHMSNYLDILNVRINKAEGNDSPSEELEEEELPTAPPVETAPEIDLTETEPEGATHPPQGTEPTTESVEGSEEE